MFIGGYITARVSRSMLILDLLIVGVIVVGGMAWSLLARADITTTGIIVGVATLLSIILGGLYANKRNNDPNKD